MIGDEAKRKEYDEVRRMGAVGNPFGGRAGGGRGGSASGSFHVDDLGDLLGNIFGRGNRGRSAGGQGAGPAMAERGQDLETTLHLSFLDAVEGLTTTVNVTSEVACHTCRGSGAAPGTAPVVCDVCGGRGVINDNQGLFSFSQPVPDVQWHRAAGGAPLPYLPRQPAWSTRPGRSRCGSPPGSRTASASGSRGEAGRDVAAVRRATSTSWSKSTSISSSAGRGRT